MTRSASLLAAPLLAGTLLLGACDGLMPRASNDPPKPAVPADAPQWLREFPDVPGLPGDLYLLGVGASPQGGDDTKEATAKAKAYIADQIETDITAVTDVIAREVAVDDRSEYSSVLKQSILTSTQQMLAGAKVEKTYRNPNSGEITVLVALNIENHVSATLARVRTGLETLGPEMGPEGEAPGARLKRLAQEYVTLNEHMPRIASLKAIVKSSNPAYRDVEEASAAVVPRYGRVMKALRSMPIQIALVSGGDQQGYADESLGEPIVFRATVDGQPLASVPVEFLLEHAGLAEITQASSTTDAQGRFSCRLSNLQLTGDGENEVWGRIDYGRLGLDELQPPLGKTAYAMMTIQSARFGLVVVEEVAGQRIPESTVKSELETLIQGWGARLVPIDQVLPGESAERIAKAQASWLRERLAGKLDYVIVGDSRAVDAGTVRIGNSEGRSAHAGGTLRLIDLRSGDELVTVTKQPGPTIAGVSRNPAMAGEQALRKFAGQVGEEVEAQMKRIFNLE